jgi:septal ring factor EnvC (AmiA/AmiB activator)
MVGIGSLTDSFTGGFTMSKVLYIALLLLCLLTIGCDTSQSLSRYKTQLAVVANQSSTDYAKNFILRVDQEIAEIEASIASASNNTVSLYQQLNEKKQKLSIIESEARVLKAEIAELEALLTEKDATRSIEVMKAIENTSFNKESLNKLAFLYEVKKWANLSEPEMIHQTVKTWLQDQIKALEENPQKYSSDDEFYLSATKGTETSPPLNIPFPPVSPIQIK